MARILLATEEAALRNLLEDTLGQHHHLTCLPSKEVMLKQVDRALSDVIVLDMDMAYGMELLTTIHSTAPALPVIAIGRNEPEVVVAVIKKGADDYLVKPPSPEKITHSVNKAFEHRSFKEEIDYLRGRQDVIYNLDRIIAKSPSMQTAMSMIRKVCATDATISLTGETGTGKSFLAGSTHFNSHRKKRPFITINCANLPESLLESELFGHEKGTFTGATKTRIGRFEQGNGGTVFLDEIGDLSLSLQAKLLRFLEEKAFERLGGNTTIQSDVRIIVATNKDLAAEIRARRFRDDLYYRINVISINLPPLRDRREDMEALAHAFLRRHCATLKKEIAGFDPQVMTMFQRHLWPGNLRELSNVIERAVLLTEGGLINVEAILLAGEEASLRPAAPEGPLPQSLVERERKHILDALEKCLWIQKDAAKELGISKRALNYKIKKLGITHPRWRKNI